MSLIYAGVGARDTPQSVLKLMTNIGRTMAARGWTLGSGGALGADQAYETGARELGGTCRIFLPWKRYEAETRSVWADDVVIADRPDIEEIAAAHHPAWHRLSQGTKKLMCRNVPVVLGEHLDEHVACVVAWTKTGEDIGGTGHTLRVARTYGVPVFNLHDPEQVGKLVDFVKSHTL